MSLAFVAFIQAREAIRLARVAGAPPPWTDDPILQKYKFTNIRRQDDRVSQWICRHVIAPYETAVYLGEWLALGRFVNWPPTIAMLLAYSTPHDLPNWRVLGKLIDQRMARGEKTWTGAYMIRSDKMGKGRYVCEGVLAPLFAERHARLSVALVVRSRRSVHTVMAGAYGCGSFMAGQIVDDWSWTPLLRDAIDEHTWAPQGPGSVRGLNRLLGRRLDGTFVQQEWEEQLMELRNFVHKETGYELSLMNIQSCLCEYDKFLRVKLGEGRPRSYYRPETAY
jgi:hypothetical protein